MGLWAGRTDTSRAGAGHGAASGSTDRTEANSLDTRNRDWHCWVPRQAGLTLDSGGVEV